MSKTIVYIGASVGGFAGGLLGTMLDHGNMMGLWSILFTLIGGIAGIWIAVKVQQ